MDITVHISETALLCIAFALLVARIANIWSRK